MTDKPTFAIIGGGQAGGQAAIALREQGFDGRIALFAAERHLPYERPPLSKEILTGTKDETFGRMRPAEFYDEQDITLELGNPIQEIDIHAKRLVSATSGATAFDKLLIATGSTLVRLPVPGEDLDGVFYLRSLDESLALRDALVPGAAVVVVGGGYIGLEVAAAARRVGAEVTVLEFAETVMARVAAPEVTRIFEAYHREEGVRLVTGARVTRIDGAGGRARAVATEDGTLYPCDVVVVGVGIAPDTTLAEAAGLTVSDGIVVDALCETSVPGIYAAGDVTNHPNADLGRRIRLESWQNAQNQAIAAARAMLGHGEPYGGIPWFWSDQYGINFQIYGLPERWDEVVLRGDPAERQFSAFYLADRRMVGANLINTARDRRHCRKAMEGKIALDPAALADPETPLKALLR